MATNENLIPIPGRLHSVATEGHVAGADEIYDDTIGKTQAEINQTIEPLPDSLAYLGDDDGQAVIPGFDPQTDTLHKVAQVLTTAEKDQVAQNLNNRPSTNGMARIELKATDDFKSVVEAQTGGNTVFVIKYDYTLTGNVTVPVGCVFEFEGGSIRGNGTGKDTITGNNTYVKTNINCFKSGLTFSGTWNIPYICDNIFDTTSYGDDDLVVDAINKLQNPSIFNTIEINKTYNLDLLDERTYGYDHAGFIVRSNVKFVLNGTINVKPNSYSGYYVIYVLNAENSEVCGGEIVGDVETHTGTSGEYGHGVLVTCSKHIYIHDIKSSKCWGDGMNVGGYAESNIGDYTTNSEDVLIERVVCDNNRRQGLSIGHVIGVVVKDSTFKNTGAIKATNPTFGIDIEPTQSDSWKQCCKNVLIDNCVFENNLNGDIALYCVYPNSIENININNVKGKIANKMSNVTITNSEVIYFSLTGGYDDLNNIVIDNCKIIGQSYINNAPYAINAIIRNSTFDNNGDSIIIRKPGWQTTDNIQFLNNTFNTTGSASLFGNALMFSKLINCVFNFGNNILSFIGASAYGCILNCSYVKLDFSVPTKHIISNCVFNTSSDEWILFAEKGSTASTYLIKDNIIQRKDIRFFKRSNTWSYIGGGEISGIFTYENYKYLFDLFAMGGTQINNVTVLPNISQVSGTTRPTLNLYEGMYFFDTSLSPARAIWWNGSTWVDATGATV